MEDKITQRGFYFLLGVILTLISIYFCKEPTSQVVEPIKIEVQKDSVKVDTINRKPIKNLTLNETNLKAEIVKNEIPCPNIVLAQAKLETGNFTSIICKQHNNLFGIKTKNGYKKYNHWNESVADYKKLISSRYKGGCYYEFLENIGYATNPNYTSLLKTMV